MSYLDQLGLLYYLSRATAIEYIALVRQNHILKPLGVSLEGILTISGMRPIKRLIVSLTAR